MSGRTLIAAWLAAAVMAACSTIPQVQPEFGTGTQFVSEVPDFQDNVGLDASMAVSTSGVPYISYFGFPQQLAKGQIAVPRPVGSPSLPGVLVASLDHGLWNRGAVVMPTDPPANVTVPFGPQTLGQLTTFTPKNVNGTDIAVGSNGDLNVVWTGPDGVWYANTTTFSTATHLYKSGSAVAVAGPISPPSVALDDAGNPWVSYTVQTSREEVKVASRSGGSWSTRTVATSGPCNACPSADRAEIVVTPSGPVVVYVDQAARAVVALRAHGTRWVSQQVERGVSGEGLDATVDKDGNVLATYDTGNGTVHLAASSGSSWSVSTVGTDGPPAGVGQQTGVAVDDAGTVYVTWVGPKGIELASGNGKTFSPIPTRDTVDGRNPTVGVTSDGSQVYVAWYSALNQDMWFGKYGEAGALAIAKPSPPPFTTGAPSTGATCAPSGTKIVLTAQSTAFDTNCLAADAGTPFSVELVNKDPFPHDFSIFPTQADAQSQNQSSAFLYSFGNPTNGSSQNTYKVNALDTGQYYFQCDFHPTTMFGTFVVAKKAK